MNAKKILLVLCLFSCSGFLLAVEDEFLTRSIQVHVETDPEFMMLTDSGIRSLLHTVGVAYKSLDEVLGKENVPENLTLSIDNLGAMERGANGKLYVFFLKLNPDNADEMVLAAKQEELLKQIIENFRQALVDSYAEYARNAGERITVLQQQADQAESELRELMRSLEQMVIPTEHLQRKMEETEEAFREGRYQIEMNQRILESLQARRAEMRKKMDQERQQDEVQRQMQGMIEQLEKQMKSMKMMVDAGTKSTAELDRIEQEMVRARIEMARRAEEMRNEFGGNILAELDQQIAERGLELEQIKMRADHLAERLAENSMKLKDSGDREIQRIKMEAARDNFARTIELLNKARLEQKLQMPPKVIVIEGKGD